MSGEARISEREAVMRERRASAKARCAALFAARTEGGARNISSCHIGYLVPGCACRDCEEMAARRFPLPQVERPRVMRSVGLAYRVIGGLVETQEILGVCCPHEVRWQVQTMIRACDAELVADLLASPNELVDGDGAADPGVSS